MSVVTDGISFNEWKHIVMTYSNSTRLIVLYIDGAEASLSTETACEGEITDDSTKALIIGDTEYSREFNGTIDEMRIYNYTLSETEVSDLYNSYTPSSVQMTGQSIFEFLTGKVTGWFVR